MLLYEISELSMGTSTERKIVFTMPKWKKFFDWIDKKDKMRDRKKQIDRISKKREDVIKDDATMFV